METEDAVDAKGSEQTDVGEGAERRVRQQNIACFEEWMKDHGAPQVMGEQGDRQELEQQAGGVIHHRHELAGGVTDADFLSGGHAKVGAEFEGVGHGEGTTVDDDDPDGRSDGGMGGVGQPALVEHLSHQTLKELQGQARPGFAVGCGAEVQSGELTEVRDRGVAVKDLQAKQLKSQERREQPRTIAMIDVEADLGDDLPCCEKFIRRLADRRQCGVKMFDLGPLVDEKCCNYTFIGQRPQIL